MRMLAAVGIGRAWSLSVSRAGADSYGSDNFIIVGTRGVDRARCENITRQLEAKARPP
jgi:hypothetical protein